MAFIMKNLRILILVPMCLFVSSYVSALTENQKVEIIKNFQYLFTEHEVLLNKRSLIEFGNIGSLLPIPSEELALTGEYLAINAENFGKAIAKIYGASTQSTAEALFNNYNTLYRNAIIAALAQDYAAFVEALTVLGDYWGAYYSGGISSAALVLANIIAQPSQVNQIAEVLTSINRNQVYGDINQLLSFFSGDLPDFFFFGTEALATNTAIQVGVGAFYGELICYLLGQQGF